MRNFDVAVVGAGPGGSTAARKLASFGFRVVLFEKSTIPGANNVCTGMFCTPCARHFGVESSVFEKVIHKEIHFFNSMTVELEEDEGFVTVLRDRFDRYLADGAVDKGADLRTQTRVTEVNILGTGRVEVRFNSTEHGKEGHLYCRAVVLADGPMSLSRRFSGLGFQVAPQNLPFAFSCDVEARENTMKHFEMYYDRDLADWGYGWVFPKRDMLNFGLVCRLPEYDGNKSLLKQRLRYLWEKHPRASKVLGGRRLIQKRGAMIPQRMAAKIVQDSIVVVGDSAGMADSMLGGGIENAMYAAEMAATVLRDALEQDRLDSGFLRQYQDTWEASERYRWIMFTEKFRDWSCRLDRLNPNISLTLKKLFTLRMKMKRDGERSLLNHLRLLLSSSYRDSMAVNPKNLSHNF